MCVIKNNTVEGGKITMRNEEFYQGILGALGDEKIRARYGGMRNI